ncbi:MAG: hypothetical protein C4532_08785 [Candidatus Abyssobacteria bacterium SURF_17]|uniref:Tetratricopeptide repeat protein n=1 Tax=Candidatus Abyssobacteria bacterium SURF_17 TaxID=2093361 RepID=A0A419EZP2_9BACT|nr:MAG: hypothetical protein C4532_08785 [Candidatus Abyssubacteria bacterium SURF_17]
MKCPVHSDKDVVGYCVECGAFGCDRCLKAIGKGESLCQKCVKAREADARGGKAGIVSKLLGDSRKRPTPPGASAASGRARVAQKTGTGRKLVIHYRQGKVVKGVTYKLDVNSLGFYLIPVEPTAEQERIYVHFSDLKAIYFVRDFEGKLDSSGAILERSTEGQETRIAFDDGEIIEGWTMHHFDPSCQRFFMVPKENNGNNISILVERSALKGLEVGEFRQGSFSEETELSGLPQAQTKGRAPLSQGESMGDLYFSMKNYDAALAEYEKVKKDYPHDKRLALKISVCNFNRGVSFIKSRKYLEAKAEFEKIAEDDPIYGNAKKKIRKIDKILKEVQKMGT